MFHGQIACQVTVEIRCPLQKILRHRPGIVHIVAVGAVLFKSNLDV